MKKPKRFSGESIPEPELKVKDVHDIYSQIVTLLKVSHYQRNSCDGKFQLQVACQSFQSYIENEYRMSSGQDTNDTVFIDDFFNKITLEKIQSKFVLATKADYFLILTLLLDLDIGSQMAKANKLMNTVLSITANDVLLTVKHLEKILVWLVNPLKISFRLKIQPLRDYINAWHKNHTIASIYLMIIFIKNFSYIIIDDFVNYNYYLQDDLFSSNVKVRKLAIKAYKIIFDLFIQARYKNVLSQFIFNLTERIIKFNEISDVSSFETISKILTKIPSLKNHFAFPDIPLSPSTKDPFRVLLMIPNIYKCTPILFKNDKIDVILHAFKKQIKQLRKKDNDSLNLILKALAEFIFLIGDIIHKDEFKSIHRSLMKKVSKLSSNIYQIVAQLSLSNSDNSIINSALGQQFIISEYLINGIISYSRKWGKKAPNIENKLISNFLYAINNANNTDALEQIFHILIKIKFNDISEELLCHFSSFLYSPNYNVRKFSAKFLLLFQNKYQIIPILILSMISTEKITELRIYIMDRLYCANENMSMLLYQIMHDKEINISSHALDLLCHLPNATSVISKFIIELIPQLGYNDSLNRRALYMLIIIKEYFPQILQPFSSHLCETILNFEVQSHHSLLFLSYMISSNPTISVDITLLGRVLKGALCSDSNARRISAALDLLYTALNFLDMESEKPSLFLRLLSLSSEIEDPDVTSKLLLALSKIGTFKKSSIKSLVGMENQEENLSRRSSFTETLEDSSFSIPISIALETFNDPSLSSDRSTAFICFLEILKLDNSHISYEFKKLILERIENMINNETALIMMQNFKSFINCFGYEVKPLLPQVLQQMLDKWDKMEVSSILSTLDDITSNILDLFAPYIFRFTQFFILKLPSLSLSNAISVFKIFSNFSKYLTTVDYLVIPAILQWFEVQMEIDYSGIEFNIPSQINQSSQVNYFIENIKKALFYLQKIITFSGAEKYASLILRTLFVLTNRSELLKPAVFDVIYEITFQIKDNITPFLQQIYRFTDIMKKEDPKNVKYKIMLECLRSDNKIPDSLQEKLPEEKPNKISRGPPKNQSNLGNINEPRNDWDAVKWIFWYEELVFHFLSNSISSAVAALLPLIGNYSIRSSLFPISYAIYFSKSQIVSKIFMNVFSSSSNPPPQVIRHFLQISELLEMTGDFEKFILNNENCKVHDFSFENLAKKAMDIGEYAQSLRYYEILFSKIEQQVEDPNFSKYAKILVFLNQNLNLRLSVNGIIDRCNEDGINLFKGTLAEDLGKYEAALKSYDKLLKKDPEDSEVLLGKMRCLESLLRFKDLEQLTESVKLDNKINPKYIQFAASSAWRLNHIEKFKEYASQLQNSNLFLRTIFALYEKKYNDALSFIQEMRKIKENEIFPLISYDYSRAFDPLCFATILTFIEEIVQIKLIETNDGQINDQDKDVLFVLNNQIHKNWLNRFRNLRESPLYMFDTLRIISLYLNNDELEPFKIQFLLKNANNGSNELVDMVMQDISSDYPEVIYAKAKIARHKKNHKLSYQLINDLLKINSESESSFNWIDKIKDPSQTSNNIYNKSNYLLNQKVLKKYIGWLLEDKMFVEAQKPLERLLKTIPNDPKLWLKWSSINLILSKEAKDETSRAKHLTTSFLAILEGLKLNPEQHLRFTIRAVSILLKQGTTEIYNTLGDYLYMIPSHVWIALLPQFIARMAVDNQDLRNVIIRVLETIGKMYPNSVLYSLLAPYKSSNDAKKLLATQIINHLKINNPKLVSQILLFSDGMIRMASTLWEQWSSSIITACVAFEANDDATKMIELLSPLYKVFDEPPKTLYDISFFSQYGKLLNDIKPYLASFSKTGDRIQLHYCFAKYTAIARKLNNIVNSLSSVRTQDASPELSEMKNSVLALPGTDYTANPVIKIESICDKFTVFNSKQHPRKLYITGNDGVKYYFLLKANEDTRLDERVMQLFEYISQIMSHFSNPKNNKNQDIISKMTISTYKVIPLSGKVGIIGWVKNCKTVFSYLSQYRERFNIPIETEKMIFQDKLQEFQKLKQSQLPITAEELLKAFKESIKSPNDNGIVTGNELQKSLIMSSLNSNDWLNRRINFSTSLAITSIAGYIIGLGDRHLKNIMMNNNNSRLIHIDFGDSFEIANNRKKYPEKVPFRLTRQFVNALEVTGTNGTLTWCCEFAMENIRNNSEQILVLLDTLIYDPLEVDEILSSRPQEIIQRINEKLTGNDFNTQRPLSVEAQVGRLIKAATNPSNLSQMYPGWGPWY